MSEPLKVSYPDIIAVRAPQVPEGATGQERKALEDGDAAAALVMFLEGHGQHGGWEFDSAADTLRCRCGDLAFEVDTKIGAVST